MALAGGRYRCSLPSIWPVGPEATRLPRKPSLRGVAGGPVACPAKCGGAKVAVKLYNCQDYKI